VTSIDRTIALLIAHLRDDSIIALTGWRNNRLFEAVGVTINQTVSREYIDHII
jgi:hypothetical protein